MFAGLQIAMDDALVVRGLERAGDLRRDRQRLGDRQRSVRDAVGERRSLDQFQHERGDATRVFQAVNGRRCWDG